MCRQAFDYSKEAKLLSETVTDLEALEAVELFLGQYLTMFRLKQTQVKCLYCQLYDVTDCSWVSSGQTNPDQSQCCRGVDTITDHIHSDLLNSHLYQVTIATGMFLGQ